MKNAFSDYSLQSIEFKGTAHAGPLEFDMPDGVEMDDGELSISEEHQTKPEAFTKQDFVNHDKEPTTMEISLDKTFTTSETFSSTTTLSKEVSASAKANVLLFEANVSTTLGLSQQFGKSKTEEKSFAFTNKISKNVPGKSCVEAAIMGRQLELKIPWWVDVELKGTTVAHFVTHPPSNGHMWGVTLFKKDKYENDSDFYGIESGKSFQISNLKHFNNKAASLKIHGDVEVQVFKKKNFKGKSRTFTKNCSNVGNDWKNKISSLKITANKNPPPPHGLMVYCRKNLKNRKKFFPAKGAYCEHDIGSGNFNDKVSSIKVFGDVKATIYEHIRCDGDSLEITTQVNSLRKRTNKFNNKLSSMKIEFTAGGMDVTFRLEKALSDTSDRTFRCEGNWEGVTVQDGVLVVGEAKPIGDDTSSPMEAVVSEYHAQAPSSPSNKLQRKSKPNPRLKEALGKLMGSDVANILSESVSDKALNDAKKKLKNGASIERLEKKSVK
ncbi:MAG: hypothetical protein ACQETH_11105 [Candidatus Rifleibacteriota bacterium]